MSLVPSPTDPVGKVLHGIIVVCVIVCVTVLMIDSKVDPTAGITVLATIGGGSTIAGAAAVIKPNA